MNCREPESERHGVTPGEFSYAFPKKLMRNLRQDTMADKEKILPALLGFYCLTADAF